MNLSRDPVNTEENLKERNRITGLSMYLIVIIFLVFAMVFLPFIYIDISSQSRGIVRSLNEDVSLYTAIGGRISYVNIVKNLVVAKGDTLMRLSNMEITARMAHNDSLVNTVALLLEDYRQLIDKNYDEIRTSKVVELYKSFKTEKLISEEKLRMIALKFERYKQLYASGVFARSEFEEIELAYKEARQDLNLFIRQHRMSWESRVLELEERLGELKGSSISLKAENDNHFLTAPISGSLDRVVGLEKGSIVSIGQKVAVISPDTALIVENMVRPEEIGLIKIGQSVKYQVDAFHYQQWGMPTGFVRDIDKNISLDKNRAYFKVYCDFRVDKLPVKNGFPMQVSKGMTVTTHYYLSRKNLLELILGRLNDSFDPRSMETTEITKSQ
ncbi:MAG: HlyD family secretion protein [Flavobacteriaceae bacterium]